MRTAIGSRGANPVIAGLLESLFRVAEREIPAAPSQSI
jgi:hypothetical protein